MGGEGEPGYMRTEVKVKNTRAPTDWKHFLGDPCIYFQWIIFQNYYFRKLSVKKVLKSGKERMFSQNYIS